ncbi:MAG: desulfoferrodoxin [DPANN group archaeon]|nr:desulfoferrodoxin [DPANN group archaeon]
MAEENGIYKCGICGNVVSVIEAFGGELVCCGESMTLFEEKTNDEGLEKHVPVITKTDKGILVKVGSVLHPMEDNHYIELIQLFLKGSLLMEKRLKSGDLPQAEFCCLESSEDVFVRALCNKHGLWKN